MTKDKVYKKLRKKTLKAAKATIGKVVKEIAKELNK